MWKSNPNENFEPSKLVKNIWLFTRKTPFKYRGVEFPGLFHTSGYVMDTLGFLAVILLESYGLFSLIALTGFGKGDNLKTAGTVVAALLIDIVLAVILHIPKGHECRWKNEFLLRSQVEDLQEGNYESEKKKDKIKYIGYLWLLKYIGIILLFLLLIFKSYGIYLLSGKNLNGQTVSVIASYLFAFLLHINFTGYFLSETAFSLFSSWDYFKWKKLARGNNLNVTAHRRCGYNIKFEMISTSLYKHFLFIKTQDRDDTSNPYAVQDIRNKSDLFQKLTPAYITEADFNRDVFIGNSIYTWGLLTDDHLQAFVAKQNSGEGRQLNTALLALKAQLQILVANTGGIDDTPESNSD